MYVRTCTCTLSTYYTVLMYTAAAIINLRHAPCANPRDLAALGTSPKPRIRRSGEDTRTPVPTLLATCIMEAPLEMQINEM